MFRAEVQTARADRLTGDVVVALPMAWQLVGFLLLGSVLAIVVFLSLADYARVETTTGYIVPETGVVPIMPGRGGVISSVPVREGQVVLAGAIIASISADVYATTGASFDDQIRRAITKQDDSLAAQARAGAAVNDARKDQLREQRIGLVDEIGQIKVQMAIQKNLVASTSEDLEIALRVAQRGFISRRDIDQRQQTLAQRQQVLSQLRQSLVTRQSALAQIGRSLAQLDAETSGQASAIAAQRAEVAQQAANAAGAQGFVLRAPRTGQVTAITARVGQPASPQVALMTIIPLHPVLRAELGIPTSAIGFVKKGQAVNVAIDTFPFQRFGTIKAKVLTVAASAITRTNSGDGRPDLVYPATVELDQQYIRAFGVNEPLVSGMTLTARIVTEKQSLLHWLFEPLYAVRNR